MSDKDRMVLKLTSDLQKGLADNLSTKSFQAIYDEFLSKYTALLLKRDES